MSTRGVKAPVGMREKDRGVGAFTLLEVRPGVKASKHDAAESALVVQVNTRRTRLRERQKV